MIAFLTGTDQSVPGLVSSMAGMSFPTPISLLTNPIGPLPLLLAADDHIQVPPSLKAKAKANYPVCFSAA